MLTHETQKQTQTIKILLVDDQPMVAAALRQMLSDQPNMEITYVEDPSKAIDVALELQPTVILQDLVMPQVDGLTLVRFFKAHPDLADIPVIVLSSREQADTKAQAFERGAHDYLVKIPESVELVARIRHHAGAYLLQQERDAATRALAKSQAALARELNAAADYIRGIIPPPQDGDLKIDWHFEPSARLGGDSFGYHKIDDDHTAIYLLDVCGHGVISALLSISAINALRGQSLAHADFLQPDSVLTALNRAFPMEDHGGLFFTIWYGVYQHSTRTLSYANAGHPPALLFGPHNQSLRLGQGDGLVIGAMPEVSYITRRLKLLPGSRLYLFSDGCFEIFEGNQELGLDGFAQALAQDETPGQPNRMWAFACTYQSGQRPDDDFSLMEIRI